jgi:hypothetical protein
MSFMKIGAVTLLSGISEFYASTSQIFRPILFKSNTEDTQA